MENSSSDRSLLWLWGKITGILNGVALINLLADLFPTLIKWKNFFAVFFSFVAKLRDFLLYPLTVFFDWLFGISLPVWIRSYLFVGIIMFSTYNYAHKVVCGISLLNFYYLKPFWRWLKKIKVTLFSVLFFPFYFKNLFNYYTADRDSKTAHVDGYFGKYLRDILLIILLFVSVNYLWVLATQ